MRFTFNLRKFNHLSEYFLIKEGKQQTKMARIEEETNKQKKKPEQLLLSERELSRSGAFDSFARPFRPLKNVMTHIPIGENFFYMSREQP